MSAELKLIAGLGNPGKAYQNTRHNYGFLVVTALAKKLGLKFKRSLLFKSLIARGEIDDRPVILALPQTFMNTSGWPIKRLVKKAQLNLKGLLVVCDDVNLELGMMRIRPSGSDGGHNGLKSIIAALETQDFSRLRLGTGTGHKSKDMVDFVLAEFTRKEEAIVTEEIDRACDCCISWIKQGIVKTMDKFNKG